MEHKNFGTPEEYSKLIYQLTVVAEAGADRLDKLVQEGKVSNEFFHDVAGINGPLITMAYLHKYRAGFQITEANETSEGKEAAVAFAQRIRTLFKNISESKGVKGTPLEVAFKRLLESSEYAVQWLTRGFLSLRLSEVQIDPPILDERTFTGTEIVDIEYEAEKYVKETYPGRYENDFTLRRLIAEAIRDDSGKTSGERAKEVFSSPELNSDFWNTEQDKERGNKHDGIVKAYALKFDEVDQWQVSERKKVLASFKERKDAAPVFSEEYRAVEDEIDKALDKVDAEARKRMDEINVAKNKELDAIWALDNAEDKA
jgi:hypothetical protein